MIAPTGQTKKSKVDAEADNYEAARVLDASMDEQTESLSGEMESMEEDREEETQC